ncbi:MAG: M13 family metallopeptidase, partial [Bacteroidota bacterium]
MSRRFTGTRSMHAILFIALFISVSIAADAADKKKTVNEINEGPSPTKNFYEWVNHDWMKSTEIPADKPGMNNFIVIREQVNKEIADLLTSLAKKPNPTDSDVKINRIYQSFMDMDRRNAKGISPLLPDLRRIDSAKTYDDIAVLFASLQKIGVASPIIMEPASDFKNSDSMIVFVAQAGLGLERESYLQDDERSKKTRQSYQNAMSELFTLASASDPAGSAAVVLQMEKDLAAIQWSNTENRDFSKIYNISDYAGVKGAVGNFNVDRYMTELGMPTTYPFNMMQPSYVAAFNKLFISKSVEQWRNYLKGQLLMSYAKLLDSAFNDVKVRYEVNRGFYDKEEPLQKQAVTYLNKNVGMLLGKTYIENSFDHEIKRKLSEVIKNISDEYRTVITGSKRMQPETKKKALEKLDKITFMVGYPDQWQDFSSLEVMPGELALNHQRISQYEHRRSVAKLGKPADKKEWGYPPQEINAFYSPIANAFVILAGILHPPFFRVDANDAEMYGGIGFVIGHEIGHGFDDQGSRFDGYGNMVNWWTETDAKKFNDIKSSLIAQANAYEILPGKFLKGELEIGEIIGDLSGAEISLRAFQRIIKTKNLNAEQGYRDFFRQLAITWRDKLRDDYKVMLLDRDSHPPSEFRG